MAPCRGIECELAEVQAMVGAEQRARVEREVSDFLHRHRLFARIRQIQNVHWMSVTASVNFVAFQCPFQRVDSGAESDRGS